MAAGQKKTGKLGDTWEDAPAGSFLRRPDGIVLNIGPDGGHVLDVPGTYTIVDADGKDGASITVKDPNPASDA